MQNGQTALAMAVDNNQSEIVQLLMAAGADATKQMMRISEKICEGKLEYLDFRDPVIGVRNMGEESAFDT